MKTDTQLIGEFMQREGESIMKQRAKETKEEKSDRLREEERVRKKYNEEVRIFKSKPWLIDEPDNSKIVQIDRRNSLEKTARKIAQKNEKRHKKRSILVKEEPSMPPRVQKKKVLPEIVDGEWIEEITSVNDEVVIKLSLKDLARVLKDLDICEKHRNTSRDHYRRTKGIERGEYIPKAPAKFLYLSPGEEYDKYVNVHDYSEFIKPRRTRSSPSSSEEREEVQEEEPEEETVSIKKKRKTKSSE